MIRFIDLTEDYFCLDSSTTPEDVVPVCAFADTITNTFVGDSNQIFYDIPDLEDISNKALQSRCISLIPDGFFDTQSEYWQEKLARLKTV
jgi:hypothetical protein